MITIKFRYDITFRLQVFGRSGYSTVRLKCLRPVQSHGLFPSSAYSGGSDALRMQNSVRLIYLVVSCSSFTIVDPECTLEMCVSVSISASASTYVHFYVSIFLI